MGSHWKRVCEVTATSKAHQSSPCRGGTPDEDERREKGWWEKTARRVCVGRGEGHAI